ncbi:MAG: hypothetical protein P8X75_00465 [Limibacillus sp.]|jgi:hypothetical protein
MSRYDPDAIGGDTPLTPEKRLWCAVLFRILQDACRPLPPKADNAQKVERDQARSWLLNSQDMRIVCELAGFDPDAMREAALKLETQDWPALKLDSLVPKGDDKIAA